MPARHIAERLRHDPLPPERRPSTRAPPKPTRPPGAAVDGRRAAHPRPPANRTAPTPRKPQVTLPVGMGLNPSAAQRPADLHRRAVRQGHRQLPVNLPGRRRRSAPSTIESPPLPEGSLTATSTSGSSSAATRPPATSTGSSSTPTSARYGIVGAADRQRQRRPGHRPADDDAHRTPAGARSARFTLDFDGGPTRGADAARRPAARTPASAAMTPWSGNPAATPSAELHPRQAPRAAAPARRRLAERPFAPTFAAAPTEHPGRRLQPASRSTISREPTASRS